jgi:hypothetical protein
MIGALIGSPKKSPQQFQMTAYRKNTALRTTYR